MEQQEIAIGLDIGTTKIVTIVGRKNEFNKIEILGFGKAQSLGVQRGVVSNITQTIESIKHAVADAETDSGEKITNCVVGIAGQHIRSLQHSDYILRENEDEVITQDDVDLLVQNVHKLVMLPGEEIIHVLPQEFKIDGEPNISEPIGMLGRRLEANLHIVVGQKAAIGNIISCVKNSDIDVSTITLEPLASAEAVLSDEEREAGVCLVDIGGGTTDVAIFKDGIIRHTAVIPFGGNVITEDIKDGCSIIEKQAELLKMKFGSAWPGENSDNEIVSIPGLRGREPKEISLKMLSKVIHARLIEIIDQVYIEIKNYGNDEGTKKLIAGIVLTGGGAQLKHIKQLFEYETGMDARIGYPNEHLGKGGRSELESPMYATGIGLLMKGIEENEKSTSTQISEIETVLVDPTGASIEEVGDHKEQEFEPVTEQKVEPNASFFDKWVKGFMNFLANED